MVTKPPRRALTDKSRENQLIALAIDVAEQQLRDGSASSAVITHFLKLGTEREKLEREKLQKENKLIEARVESLAQAQRIEELYEQALSAMKSYRGEEDYLE